MTFAKWAACFVAFVAVVAVGVPLSLVAAVLAHAADWLDDLSYQLLDGWLP
jgi:ABC-type antimicrobial peptide transport system permease subunit